MPCRREFPSPGGGSAAGGNIHVTVGVSTDGNGNLMPFVEKVASDVSDSRIKAAAPKLIKESVSQSSANFGAAQANAIRRSKTRGRT